MTRDWGSRDRDFIALTARVRDRLVALAGAAETHDCVPIQGSGTYAVEAMIGSLVPPGGHVLVEVNGAYGRRVVAICERLGRPVTAVDSPEDRPFDVNATRAALESIPAISHVVAIQCETTSGVLNPLTETAALAARAGKRLLIDAMSSFGALPLDARSLPFEAVAASSNKCLEGAPGIGFVIARRDSLKASRGIAPSLSLDLSDQWRGFEANGQWRFTPPTHVVAALEAALAQLVAEGGAPARLARYRDNCRRLVAGMRALGFETTLRDEHQAPIIVTFNKPADPSFDFNRFYDALHQRGFAIYPGKLTRAETFRVGCIGAIGASEIDAAIAAIAEVVANQKIRVV